MERRIVELKDVKRSLKSHKLWMAGDATGVQASFVDANFWHVELTALVFENIDFSRVKFDNVWMYDCIFKNCKFDASYFFESQIAKTIFVNCQFEESIFELTHFLHCQFYNSHLSDEVNGRLGGSSTCEREGSDEDDLNRGEGTNFAGTWIEQCNFTGCRFPYANMSKMDVLTSVMHVCYFRAAILSNSVFDGCDIVMCFFGRSDLSKVDFEGENLHYSDFFHTNMTETNFAGANDDGVKHVTDTITKWSLDGTDAKPTSPKTRFESRLPRLTSHIKKTQRYDVLLRSHLKLR